MHCFTYVAKNMSWDETTWTELVAPADTGSGTPTLVVLSGVNTGEFHVLSAGVTVIGRGDTCGVRLTGEGVSRAHCTIEPGPTGWVIRDNGSANGTFVNGTRIEAAQLVEGDKIAIHRTLLRFGFQDALDVEYQQRIYESAVRDEMTGLYNHRYFRERLESEVAFALRHDQPVAVSLIDVDHFKAVNDEHGHAAGNEVLAAFAARLRKASRREDLLARIGGDEFAVCSRATAGEAAAVLAERIRAAVSKSAVVSIHGPIRVTASIGVAAIPDEDAETAAELLAIADRALYRAKNAGRNRVERTRPMWHSEKTR